MADDALPPNKIRLGNGAVIFACCGGGSWHVGSWHPEMAAEHERERAATAAREKKHRERLLNLRGATLDSIEEVRGCGLTISFRDGRRLEIKLTGGELDGHFDPPANRSISVEVTHG